MRAVSSRLVSWFEGSDRFRKHVQLKNTVTHMMFLVDMDEWSSATFKIT
jgi:hypothetical protein